MTAHAAFKATYSDLKIVKGRKCVQIVLELPLEQADAALLALGGVPRPDQETWVAVCRIDPNASQRPAPAPAKDAGERRKFNEMPRAQQAGIRSNEKQFWYFLQSIDGFNYSTADEAAAGIRTHCRVPSRANIDKDAKAEWDSLETRY